MMNTKLIIVALVCLLQGCAYGQPFDPHPNCLNGGIRMLQSSMATSELEGTTAHMDRSGTSHTSQSVALRGSNRRLFISNDENSVFRFNLRLFWSEGYCWQEEIVERHWCLACPGTICNENDVLWIMDCNPNDPKQQFVWTENMEDDEESDDDGGRLIPYTRPDLCWHRTNGPYNDVEFKLRTCDFTNDRQVFDGFDTTQAFEMKPRGFPEYCMTQDHHPKREELVYREPCSTAQVDNTSKWVVEGGSIVPPTTVSSTTDTCEYDALLENGDRLEMNKRVEVMKPIEAFMVMQNDGNLTVWSGTRQNRGKLIWKSNVSISPDLGYQFVTVLQGDGHLLTRSSGEPRFVFRSNSVSGHGDYFLAVNCDGETISIFRKDDDDGSIESIWTTEPR